MGLIRTLSRAPLVFVAALLLILAACVDDAGVSEALSRNYGQCLTGSPGERHLTVTCRSSPFAERPEAERVNTARKVAEYVRDHHPKYKGADSVTVVFLSKKETATEEVKHPQASYTFTAAELDPPFS
jgi:hypothetical protein